MVVQAPLQEIVLTLVGRQRSTEIEVLALAEVLVPIVRSVAIAAALVQATAQAEIAPAVTLA